LARYYEHHSDVWQMYCYATDYPHVEGGKDSRALLENALSSVPAPAREQFFATNGELLLPA
jgi:hypothetical protein